MAKSAKRRNKKSRKYTRKNKKSQSQSLIFDAAKIHPASIKI